jgi:maleylacetate reductase
VSPIIRFGVGSLAELSNVYEEAGVSRALLVASSRGARAAVALPVVGAYDGVEPHVPHATVHDVAAMAERLAADALLGFGGGSAIDTAKAAAAELARRGSDIKVIAIPTTYAGAEWTPYFGTLLAPGRKGGGMDERARPVAAVYDPALTLELRVTETVGTAMNALAHCAEAYYHPQTKDEAADHADAGAARIGDALPVVVERPSDLDARTRLLEGAMHAALALGASGLCLAHAMAQGLGGRYGLPHGAMNALCLPPALPFNEQTVPDAIARFGTALGTADPAARCEELARLGGFERLRDHGVPEAELGVVAAEIAARPGARANPRPAGAEEVEALLRWIW